MKDGVERPEGLSLDELLAPFRRQVEMSGLTESELDRLFEEAREEAFRRRRESPT